jgi:hypothetical protein
MVIYSMSLRFGKSAACSGIENKERQEINCEL